MKMRIVVRLVLAVVASLPLMASAQITITNGVQKYASLVSTTVTMTGKCELWVTNSATPLTACTINAGAQTIGRGNGYLSQSDQDQRSVVCG
jgi:hypothetical protein